MSDRRHVSRRRQRAARALAVREGISYQQAVRQLQMPRAAAEMHVAADVRGSANALAATDYAFVRRLDGRVDVVRDRHATAQPGVHYATAVNTMLHRDAVVEIVDGAAVIVRDTKDGRLVAAGVPAETFRPAYRTPRGFTGWSRIEVDGQVVEVQGSSEAMHERCWLRLIGPVGLSGRPVPLAGLEHGVCTAPAHVDLDAGQARELRDGLRAWLVSLCRAELGADLAGEVIPPLAEAASGRLLSTSTTNATVIGVDDLNGHCRVTWTGQAHLTSAPRITDAGEVAAGRLSACLGAGQASAVVAALTTWLSATG